MKKADCKKEKTVKDIPQVNLEYLEDTLWRNRWGEAQINAILHTLWDYSNEYLIAVDNRIKVQHSLKDNISA